MRILGDKNSGYKIEFYDWNYGIFLLRGSKTRYGKVFDKRKGNKSLRIFVEKDEKKRIINKEIKVV